MQIIVSTTCKEQKPHPHRDNLLLSKNICFYGLCFNLETEQQFKKKIPQFCQRVDHDRVKVNILQILHLLFSMNSMKRICNQTYYSERIATLIVPCPFFSTFECITLSCWFIILLSLPTNLSYPALSGFITRWIKLVTFEKIELLLSDSSSSKPYLSTE